MDDPNAHANMVLTLVGLGALALGTLAMIYRAVRSRTLSRQTNGHQVLQQFVADVKRGEGFTFHKPADQAPPALRWDDWMRLVNDRPDEVPHLGIEGATGTTKTTLAQAILSSRQGQAVVITAKPDEHEWGGLPIVTIDDDGSFTTAERTIRALLDEVARRLVAAKRREAVGPWLSVVLDDFTRLRAKCPSAPELIELVGDQGRSIRVRLILITRSKLVEALGIKGQSDWRDNLVFIALDRQRRATLEWDGTTYQLDTQPAHQLARRAIPPARWWQPDPLLSSLFGESSAVPVRAGAGDLRGLADRTSTGGTVGTPRQEAVPLDESVPPAGEGVPAILTDEAIRTLYRAWGSKNKVAALLTGTKAKRLEQIDRALAAEPAEEVRG